LLLSISNFFTRSLQYFCRIY